MMNKQARTNQFTRELHYVSAGQKVSDGDGVNLTRLIGTQELDMLDPFLLLDSFESDQSQDYIGGFPSHPHRGFETITYMLAGKMRHKDSAGNEGVIEANGVQWMTAGKGIIHSEMPEQTQGLLHGFQLWANLPKSEKMTEPKYQEFPADKVAIEKLENGGVIRVIAGNTNNGTTGVVRNNSIDPTYMDITLPAHASFEQQLNHSDNAFIYVIEGELSVGEQQQVLPQKHLGVLTPGVEISVSTQTQNTRFLLVAGEPLNEAVVRAGPFVMNTKTELMQAFQDYQRGNF